VDCVKLVGVLVSELPGDQCTDVAASSCVLLVPEDIRHQPVPDVSDLPEVHAWLIRQRCRESEAGQRWHDHVERIGRIVATCGRVGERVDDLGPVPERPWPAVAEDQRHRIRPDAGLAHEVNRHAADVDAVVLIGVDAALGGAPVEAVRPEGNELLQVRPAHTVVAVAAGIQRPSGSSQPATQVIEHLVGDADRRRLERERSGRHGTVLLAVEASRAGRDVPDGRAAPRLPASACPRYVR
jgi:hypothetical protein